MTTLPGISPWRLRIRRETDGIAILQAKTYVQQAVLPDTLFGQPVIRLGNRAISAHDWEADGESVTLACGSVPSDAKWDNRALCSLVLPDTLTEVGDYALQGCSSLTSIELHDRPIRWGACILLGCGALRQILLKRDHPEDCGCMAYFAGELSSELEITVSGPDGPSFRLLFPEYSETEEEFFTDHLDFHYHLSGAGYQYHHAFVNHRLNFYHYDRNWKSFLGMDYSLPSAARIAYNRLRWPVQLSERSQALYSQYLKAHASDALTQILLEKDTAGLQFLLHEAPPERSAITAACELAREENATALLALLLEDLHRRSDCVETNHFSL
ncbi:MAG: hypothetical protein V8R55_10155 [Dysosmobacter sp.]